MREAATLRLSASAGDFNSQRPSFMCQSVAVAANLQGWALFGGFQHPARDEFTQLLEALQIRTDGGAFDHLDFSTDKQTARKRFLLAVADLLEAMQ